VQPDEVHVDPAAGSAAALQWRTLADRLALPYFASPDWALAWWETIADGSGGEVAVWRDTEGVAEAVVGVARRQERIHARVPLSASVWTNLGSGIGAADHCAWPVVRHRLEDVHAWLLKRARGHPLLLRDLDPDVGVPVVPPTGRIVSRSRCPRLEIPSSEEPLGRSSNFRQQLRSYQRKADRVGLEFRWIPPREMTKDVLDRLVVLHAERRASVGGATSFGDDRLRFHRRLLDLGDGVRGPAAMVAARRGEVVGILYGFLWRNVFAYYQSGWEPAWERIRLGYLLVSQSIRAAGDAGARWFDMLRGVEPYKYRFGAFDRVDETWIVPTGAAGRMLLGKYRAKDWIDRRRVLGTKRGQIAGSW